MDEFYDIKKYVLETKTPILSEPRFLVPRFVIWKSKTHLAGLRRDLKSIRGQHSASV